MNIVLSPSSIKLYVHCPRQFCEKYIRKTIPYTQSAAAARGERLHELMEQAVNKGWSAIDWPEEANMGYAKGFVGSIVKLKMCGWDVHTEYEAHVSKAGLPLEWDTKASYGGFLRSRIDVWAIHKDFPFVYIFDYKTGRHYPDNDIQLACNALTLYPVTGITQYKVAFCYLDDGQVEAFDVRVPVECYLDRTDAPPRVKQVDDIIRRMEKSYETEDWPETANPFCRWCRVDNCSRRKCQLYSRVYWNERSAL